MGQWEGGDGEGATGRGETGKGAKGRGEEGASGVGFSQMDMMKCLGGHVECLGGMRLQSFLTLFTRATPGTPASIIKFEPSPNKHLSAGCRHAIY